MGFKWKLFGFVTLVSGFISALPVLAQDRSDTGRHKPVVRVVDEEENKSQVIRDDKAWSFEINGGMVGGGDLFCAYNTAGDTIAWGHETSDNWVSQRIHVRVENSFGVGFQVQRRMGDWYSLRGGASYSQMDIVAEAPIVETAEVFSYDLVDVWMLSMGAEVRLTVLTESYPYLTGDLVFVDFSPRRHEFLSQSNAGGRLGLGYHHQFDSIWAFNVEIGLSRSPLTSIYFPTPEGVDPENIRYENENQLTLFEVKFGVRLKI